MITGFQNGAWTPRRGSTETEEEYRRRLAASKRSIPVTGAVQEGEMFADRAAEDRLISKGLQRGVESGAMGALDAATLAVGDQARAEYRDRQRGVREVSSSKSGVTSVGGEISADVALQALKDMEKEDGAGAEDTSRVDLLDRLNQVRINQRRVARRQAQKNQSSQLAMFAATESDISGEEIDLIKDVGAKLSGGVQGQVTPEEFNAFKGIVQNRDTQTYGGKQFVQRANALLARVKMQKDRTIDNVQNAINAAMPTTLEEYVDLVNRETKDIPGGALAREELFNNPPEQICRAMDAEALGRVEIKLKEEQRLDQMGRVLAANAPEAWGKDEVEAFKEAYRNEEPWALREAQDIRNQLLGQRAQAGGKKMKMVSALDAASAGKVSERTLPIFKEMGMIADWEVKVLSEKTDEVEPPTALGVFPVSLSDPMHPEQMGKQVANRYRRLKTENPNVDVSIDQLTSDLIDEKGGPGSFNVDKENAEYLNYRIKEAAQRTLRDSIKERLQGESKGYIDDVVSELRSVSDNIVKILAEKDVEWYIDELAGMHAGGTVVMRDAAGGLASVEDYQSEQLLPEEAAAMKLTYLFSEAEVSPEAQALLSKKTRQILTGAQPSTQAAGLYEPIMKPYQIVYENFVAAQRELDSSEDAEKLGTITATANRVKNKYDGVVEGMKEFTPKPDAGMVEASLGFETVNAEGRASPGVVQNKVTAHIYSLAVKQKGDIREFGFLHKAMNELSSRYNGIVTGFDENMAMSNELTQALFRNGATTDTVVSLQTLLEDSAHQNFENMQDYSIYGIIEDDAARRELREWIVGARPEETTRTVTSRDGGIAHIRETRMGAPYRAVVNQDLEAAFRANGVKDTKVQQRWHEMAEAVGSAQGTMVTRDGERREITSSELKNALGRNWADSVMPDGTTENLRDLVVQYYCADNFVKGAVESGNRDLGRAALAYIMVREKNQIVIETRRNLITEWVPNFQRSVERDLDSDVISIKPSMGEKGSSDSGIEFTLDMSAVENGDIPLSEVEDIIDVLDEQVDAMETVLHPKRKRLSDFGIMGLPSEFLDAKMKIKAARDRLGEWIHKSEMGAWDILFDASLRQPLSL